jgi:Protein of unknown function (DUF3313)
MLLSRPKLFKPFGHRQSNEENTMLPTMLTTRKTLLTLTAAFAITVLSACSTIPLPSEPSSIDGQTPLVLSTDGDAKQFRVRGDLKIANVVIETPRWLGAESLADKAEIKEVTTRFQLDLQRLIQAAPRADGQAITVKATITEGKTVSPALNVVSTILLFMPVDRGGAVVELQAMDASGKVIAAMMYRYSGEIMEFGANFSKTAQIQVATQRAAERFAKLLAEK